VRPIKPERPGAVVLRWTGGGSILVREAEFGLRNGPYWHSIAGPREESVLRRLWRRICDDLASLTHAVGLTRSHSNQEADMDEKQRLPTDTNSGGEGESGAEEGRQGELLPDGTHLHHLVDVSVPGHGVNGGEGEITWHPERGLRFRIEAESAEKFSGLEDVLSHFVRPREPSAGAVLVPSRDPQLTARVAGTGDTIRVYQLAADVNKESRFGTSGVGVKLVISGTAVAATVRIGRDSPLSYWHETLGRCRLLIPDVCMYQWPKQEDAKWTSGNTYRSTLRSSCPLSETPTLALYSASALPQRRRACWLVFEPDLIPDGEREWYTPDVCLAAKSLLSFLCGKRLPFLWTDRFLDDTHVTRTYHGPATVDDCPQADLGYQPAPLHSVEHGGAVVESLPSLFAAYMTLRKWFDLEWIVGPLWYAIKAYLDDKLGLASVSLERFASAHDAFLDGNPEQKRPKVKFLAKQQSKVLRGELSDAVEAFVKEKGIELTAGRSPAVAAIIDDAVDFIAKLDDSLFPADAVEALRAKMKEAVVRADKSGKLKLDETKTKIIDRRIDSFAEKTNPDKLTEALEFDGLSVSDAELEAVMKRNDCLHGRRTLQDANSMDEIRREVDRFDRLRTLINKAVLARLGYRGLYVDYSARPPRRQFPVNSLASELKPVEPEE